MAHQLDQATDDEFSDAIIAAINEDSVEALDLALGLPGATINSSMPLFDEPWIIMAAKNKKRSVFKHMLSLPDIDLNVLDGTQRNLLHVAASKVFMLGDIPNLLDAGLDVNQPDVDGERPLDCCMKSRNIEAVKLYVGNGAVFDERTALATATAGGPEIAKWFLENVDAARSGFFSPLPIPGEDVEGPPAFAHAAQKCQWDTYEFFVSYMQKNSIPFPKTLPFALLYSPEVSLPRYLEACKLAKVDPGPLIPMVGDVLAHPLDILWAADNESPDADVLGTYLLSTYGPPSMGSEDDDAAGGSGRDHFFDASALQQMAAELEMVRELMKEALEAERLAAEAEGAEVESEAPPAKHPVFPTPKKGACWNCKSDQSSNRTDFCSECGTRRSAIPPPPMLTQPTGVAYFTLFNVQVKLTNETAATCTRGLGNPALYSVTWQAQDDAIDVEIQLEQNYARGKALPTKREMVSNFRVNRRGSVLSVFDVLDVDAIEDDYLREKTRQLAQRISRNVANAWARFFFPRAKDKQEEKFSGDYWRKLEFAPLLDINKGLCLAGARDQAREEGDLEREALSCALCTADLEGPRFTCLECPPSMDVCKNCLRVAQTSQLHRDHKFVPVAHPGAWPSQQDLDKRRAEVLAGVVDLADRDDIEDAWDGILEDWKQYGADRQAAAGVLATFDEVLGSMKIEGLQLTIRTKPLVGGYEFGEMKKIFANYKIGPQVGYCCFLQYWRGFFHWDAKTLEDALPYHMHESPQYHESLAILNQMLAHQNQLHPATSDAGLELQIAFGFDKVDADGSGELDRDEVRNALVKLGQVLTDEEFEVLWQEADSDGSGQIDFQEYRAFVLNMMKAGTNPALGAALLQADSKFTGSVSQGNQAALMELDESLAVQIIPVDGEGRPCGAPQSYPLSSHTIEKVRQTQLQLVPSQAGEGDRKKKPLLLTAENEAARDRFVRVLELARSVAESKSGGVQGDVKGEISRMVASTVFPESLTHMLLWSPARK